MVSGILGARGGEQRREREEKDRAAVHGCVSKGVETERPVVVVGIERERKGNADVFAEDFDIGHPAGECDRAGEQRSPRSVSR